MKFIAQQDYAKALADNGLAAAALAEVDDDTVRRAIVTTLNALVAGVANAPAGPDLDPELVAPVGTPAQAIAAFFQNAPPASISLAFLGEDHSSDADAARARTVIDAISAEQIELTLPVFERGMAGRYPSPTFDGSIVREENITQYRGCNFGFGLRARQRSLVMAGYLVLLLAGGSQTSREKVLLFYGANHQDILAGFDSLAAAADTTHHLLKRPRYLLVMPPSEDGL